MEYFGDSQWRQVLTTVLQAGDYLKSEYRLQSSTDTRVQVTELSLSETLSEPLSEVLKNPLFDSVSADL